MSEVLERGHIYFLFRPKPGEDAPTEDPQAFFLVLSPHDRALCRVIALSPHKMPELAGGRLRKHWGVVESVARRPEELQLEPGGGPPARPLGKGLYAIARHERHAHLAYVLEEPRRVRNPQWRFGIEREASYLITVRNPEVQVPPGSGSLGAVTYPDALQRRFTGHRLIIPEPIELLDYPGAEILLVGTEEDVREDLGLQLDAAHEQRHGEQLFAELRRDDGERLLDPRL